jgi:hypothetical protein
VPPAFHTDACVWLAAPPCLWLAAPPIGWKHRFSLLGSIIAEIVEEYVSKE